MSPEPSPAASASDRARLVEVNEALVLAGLRQHELMEEAEKLYAELRAIIAERERMVG